VQNRHLTPAATLSHLNVTPTRTLIGVGWEFGGVPGQDPWIGECKTCRRFGARVWFWWPVQLGLLVKAERIVLGSWEGELGAIFFPMVESCCRILAMSGNRTFFWDAHLSRKSLDSPMLSVEQLVCSSSAYSLHFSNVRQQAASFAIPVMLDRNVKGPRRAQLPNRVFRWRKLRQEIGVSMQLLFVNVSSIAKAFSLH